MKARYTKPSEAMVASFAKAATESNPASPPEQSFFHTALKPQAIAQQIMQLNLDPAAIVLFTAIFEQLQKQNEIAFALYQELKMQNDIALIKMKEAEVSKQQAEEAAALERIEDEKRFAEISPSLYT